jgi:hypothetical protein
LCWLSGLQAGQGGGDQVGPWVVGRESEPASSGVAGDAGRGGEQVQSKAFGFPAAGGVIGEGEHLHPCGEFACERDDFASGPARSATDRQFLRESYYDDAGYLAETPPPEDAAIGRHRTSVAARRYRCPAATYCVTLTATRLVLMRHSQRLEFRS